MARSLTQYGLQSSYIQFWSYLWTAQAIFNSEAMAEGCAHNLSIYSSLTTGCVKHKDSS